MSILTPLSLDSKKRTKINFDGGELSSDGGLFLINEFAKKLGFTDVLKERFHTTDSSSSRLHKDSENLMQVIYQIIAAYNSDDCADSLRTDPVFNDILGNGRIASQPTLSRFFNRMDEASLDCFDDIDSILRDKVYMADKPDEVVLDIDTTLLNTYGDQEGSAFNFHYQDYGYHPKLVFEYNTGDLIKAELCSGTQYCSCGSGDFMKPVLEEYQDRGIRTRLRGDSGFASPELYEVCEDYDCGYTIRLKENAILRSKIAEKETALNKEIADKELYQEYVCRYYEFMYKAGAWSKERRVVCKLEKPADMMVVSKYTFVVTNITDDTAEGLVKFYCGRGQMENYIKECKNGFDFSSVSSHSMIVNANRLRIHQLAYNLFNWFRRLVLPEKMKKKQVSTIRNSLLKIAARAVHTAGYIYFKLCSSFPYIREYMETLQNIREYDLPLE